MSEKMSQEECHIKIVRTHPTAVMPTKAHKADTGYDLTIIAPIKTVGNTTYFTTGLKMSISPGYYTEVHSRSSLTKTGFMVKNCVGIVDEPYRGEIIVCLERVESDTELYPELKLPFKGFQLVIRRRIEATFEEVSELDETERGSGGFGSTNK